MYLSSYLEYSLGVLSLNLSFLKSLLLFRYLGRRPKWRKSIKRFLRGSLRGNSSPKEFPLNNSANICRQILICITEKSEVDSRTFIMPYCYLFSIAVILSSLRWWRSSFENGVSMKISTRSIAVPSPTTLAPKQSTLALLCSRDRRAEK